MMRVIDFLAESVSVKQLVEMFEHTDVLLDQRRAVGDAAQDVIDVRGWIMEALEKKMPEACDKWYTYGDGASDMRKYFLV